MSDARERHASCPKEYCVAACNAAGNTDEVIRLRTECEALDEAKPDADVWRWTCHRCGYFVESVELDDTLRSRDAHLLAHWSAVQEGVFAGEPKAAGKEP